MYEHVCVCACTCSSPYSDTLTRFPRASAPPSYSDWWPKGIVDEVPIVTYNFPLSLIYNRQLKPSENHQPFNHHQSDFNLEIFFPLSTFSCLCFFLFVFFHLHPSSITVVTADFHSNTRTQQGKVTQDGVGLSWRPSYTLSCVLHPNCV